MVANLIFCAVLVTQLAQLSQHSKHKADDRILVLEGGNSNTF